MKKRKKIGIDARMYGKEFTGIGRFTSEIVRRLPLLMPDTDFTFFLNADGYENLKTPVKNVQKVLCEEKIYSFSEQTAFLKTLYRAECDLVYFLHFNVPLLYFKPFATVIHDLTLLDFPGKKMNKWWHRWAFYAVFYRAARCARGVATVSDFTKNELVKRFKIDQKKVHTIYNGVDESFFTFGTSQAEAEKQVRKKFGVQKPFFLYTGVWREHKNILGLLQAFAKLIREGLDAELVMTGRGGVYEDEVKRVIAEEGIPSRVVLPGLVSEDDLKFLFRAAQVFVFPSFSEGFGLPSLEAMALGTPVVCSNTSCMPEVCGEAAEYFNPRDIDDMATKMKKVFSDMALRAELIKRGEKRAKKFSWENSAILSKNFLSAIL